MNIIIAEITTFFALIIAGLILLIFIFLYKKLSNNLVNPELINDNEKVNCRRCGRSCKSINYEKTSYYAILYNICPICNEEYQRALNNETQKQQEIKVKCDYCEGSGKIKGYRCEECKGRGFTTPRGFCYAYEIFRCNSEWGKYSPRG